MTRPEKLIALRAQMSAAKVTVYLVGSSDPHQSEFVSPHYQTRAWLSGFSGSAGTLVVSQSFAGLWVDSRYWIEAELALTDSGIQLFRMGQSEVPSVAEWIAKSQGPGSVVSYDGACVSLAFQQELQTSLFSKRIMVAPGNDLVGLIWEDRPALPQNPVAVFDEKLSGAGRKDKLERIAAWMQQQSLQWYFISALDEICWVLNLRGSDSPYSPLFHAWLLVGTHGHVLFVDDGIFPEGLYAALAEDSISMSPYETLSAYLQTLPSEDMILLPNDTTSALVYRVTSHMNQVIATGPVPAWKAQKTEAEIGALKVCLQKDGIAMVRFLCWLEQQGIDNSSLDEFSLAAKLVAFRAEQQGFRTESFPAIVAFGSNAAIVHYRPTAANAFKIGKRGLLLIDSGGQYADGTTDITRVVSRGKPELSEIEAYTLVLKGHIRLSMARFPRGTHGTQLDILARQDLWNKGRDYGHGTGHGIGFVLNVHEGPQRISAGISGMAAALEPGNVQSNEPGYYLEGKYGVRIESMILVRENKQNPAFLEFETLTLCPYESSLIDVSLLDEKEKVWLNAYHAQVYKELNKHLSNVESKWLKEKTAAID